MTDFVSKYKLVFKDLASKRMLKLTTISKAMSKGLRKGAKVMGALGLASAAAALKITNGFANRADEIAKFTKETGFAAKSMQELEFITDRQGASFENSKNGVRTFTKNLGELRAGFGTLETALNKIDPALKKNLVNSKSAEDAYFLYLEAVASTKNVADKAALAAAGFSKRGGKDILRMTAQGIEGFKALRAEAVKFRPPLTAAQLSMAEDYKDKLTNLKSALGSLGDSAGSSAIPFLTKIADSLSEFIVLNREMINLQLSKFFGKLSAFIKTVDFEKVRSDVKSFAKALVSFGKVSLDIVSKLGGFGATLKGLGIIFVAVKILPFIFMLTKFAALFSPIGLAIQGVILVGALLIKNWDKIKAVASSVGIDLDGIFSNISNSVKLMGANFIVGVKSGVQSFQNMRVKLGSIFSAIGASASAAWSKSTSVIKSSWDNIKLVLATGVNFYIAQINRIIGIINKISGTAIGKRLGASEITLIKQINTDALRSNPASNANSQDNTTKVEVALTGKVEGTGGNLNAVAKTTSSSGSNFPAIASASF